MTALLVNGQTIQYDSCTIVQDGTNPATYLFYSTATGLKGAQRAQDIQLLNADDPQSAPPQSALGAQKETP